MTKSLAILGGAGAIGRAVTKAALSEKWHVTVLDLKKTVDQYPVPEGANVKYIDLFDEKLMASAVEALGNIDGFVNAAGFTSPMKPVQNTELKEIKEVIQVNLIGAFALTKLLLPKLKTNQGAIVNIASGLAHYARPNFGPYSAAKAGLISLTKTLALEVAPDVRVNAVAPSAIDTDFIRGGAGRTKADPLDVDFNMIAEMTPLKRAATPEDVVGPIMFLLSDASKYMTGQVLWVNGGSYMP